MEVFFMIGSYLTLITITILLFLINEKLKFLVGSKEEDSK